MHSTDIYVSFALATGMDAGRFGEDGRRLEHSCCAPGMRLCEMIAATKTGAERCVASHLSANTNATDTGEAFVCRCHAGLVFATAPVVKNGERDGGVSCYPCLLWEGDEQSRQEIIDNVRGLGLDEEAVRKAASTLQSVHPRRMRAIAETLYGVATRLSGGESPALAERRERSHQQMDVADSLPDAKKDERLYAGYPLHMEKELLGRVRLGDRAGARALLNELLGRVFAKTAGNIDVTKARLLELVVMISRAAVESGAEMESLLGMNYHYIAELSNSKDFEEVCVWVVRALDAFMDAVYSTRNTRSAQLLGDALSYIGGHYAEALTLDIVAKNAHLSPYYLSHLFKEELDVTFVEYLTNLRVAEAKRLLRGTGDSVTQIAFSLGYDDAGYFGKVFKRATGLTPNAYRKRPSP